MLWASPSHEIHCVVQCLGGSVTRAPGHLVQTQAGTRTPHAPLVLTPPDDWPLFAKHMFPTCSAARTMPGHPSTLEQM
jgi:hypothetical protein